MQFFQSADRSVLDFIYQNMHSAFLDFLMPIVSSLGNVAFIWIFTAVVLLTIKRFRLQGLMILVSVALCGLVGNLILKPFVTRVRPYDVNTAVRLLIPRLTDFSFPSGHTMAAFASATVIFRMNRRENRVFAVAAVILAALIAFSRLYLYVHYPSDVLAGMLLGILVALLTIRLFKPVTEKRNRPKIT